MTDILEKMAGALIAGNVEETRKLAQQALDCGAKAKEVLEKGLLPGMDTVGQRFKLCEMFIPEVLRSAKSMHGAMDLLRPLLSENEAAGSGTVVIGTVAGDLHLGVVLARTCHAHSVEIGQPGELRVVDDREPDEDAAG